MPLITLIILAVIQGLTEFLPVSSSGHLNLLYRIFGIKDDTVLLSIILHVATLLSVIIYYRKDILPLIKNPFCKTNRKILVTTITTSILVLIFKPIIDKLFDFQYLFIFFIITAFLLFLSEYLSERQYFMSRTKNSITNSKELVRSNILDMNISYKAAIILGITQAIAVIPGISRSGSTIAVSGIMGVKEDRAKYSFLISIPIIILSLFYEIITNDGLENINYLSLAIAFVVCFFIGLLSIKWTQLLSKKNSLSYFGYYLLILSLLLILNAAVFKLF